MRLAWSEIEERLTIDYESWNEYHLDRIKWQQRGFYGGASDPGKGRPGSVLWRRILFDYPLVYFERER